MSRYPLTQEVLLQAKKDGVSTAELAARLGVSRQNVSVAQNRHGIRLWDGRGPRNTERDRQIVGLCDAGLSYRALAVQFGLSPTRVVEICNACD